MNRQTEALKLALKALEYNGLLKRKQAITAIREALAEQPAQQDSETITQNFTGLPKRKLRYLLSAGWQINGVCFQRTEEDGTVRRGAATTGGMVLWWNTEQTAQQQEPVAWITKNGKGWLRWHKPEDSEKNKDSIPLYTAPASKPWVGLNAEECNSLLFRSEDIADAIARTSAKLREKNA